MMGEFEKILKPRYNKILSDETERIQFLTGWEGRKLRTTVYKNLTDEHSGNDEFTTLIKIFKLVSEARKEFPEFEDIGDLVLYRIACDEWKRKWFGKEALP